MSEGASSLPIELEALAMLLDGQPDVAETLVGVMDRGEFNVFYRAIAALHEIAERSMNARQVNRSGGHT